MKHKMTTTMTNIIRVFRPPTCKASAHIASNRQHWMDQYNRLYEINKEHRRSLKELYEDNDQYCKPSNMYKKSTLVPRSVDMIQYDIKDLQERRKDDMRQFHEAQNAFTDIYKALKENIEKDVTNLKLEKVYDHARHTLDKQSVEVENCKKRYHKDMFKIEKATIKSKLATQPNAVYKAEKRMRTLNERSKVSNDKYQDALIEWRKHAEHLSQVAANVQDKFIEREGKRVNLIIGNLGACFNNEKTGLKSNNDSDMLFRGIDGNELIADIVKDMTETIVIPVYEPYIPGQTDVTYATAKSELPDNEDTDIDDGDSDLENIEDTEFKHEIQANRKLKRLRKSQVFIVTEEYEKRNSSEINLVIGERVKQLLPANAEGYAFGEVNHGKMRKKKKKGYYPECNVSLIELLESEEDDEEESTSKHKKKIVKKVIARAKAKRLECSSDDRMDNEKAVETDELFENWFLDMDEDEEAESDNKKVHRKSKFKKLVSAVKPKRKDSGKSHKCDQDDIADFEKEIEEVDDILTLYRKKGKMEKLKSAIVGARQSKSEYTHEDGDEKNAKYRKNIHSKNPLKVMKALQGGRHERPMESASTSTTMVIGFDEEEDIGDMPEMPKKKSKKFSKLKKLFKKGKKQRVGAESENDNGDIIDFQFIKSKPELIQRGTHYSNEITEVMDIDENEEDFGYVRFME